MPVTVTSRAYARSARARGQVGTPPIGSSGPGRKVYACPDPSGTAPLRAARILPQRHSPCFYPSHSRCRLCPLRHGRLFLRSPRRLLFPLQHPRLLRRLPPPTSRRPSVRTVLRQLPVAKAPQRRKMRASPTSQPRRRRPTARLLPLKALAPMTRPLRKARSTSWRVMRSRRTRPQPQPPCSRLTRTRTQPPCRPRWRPRRFGRRPGVGARDRHRAPRRLDGG